MASLTRVSISVYMHCTHEGQTNIDQSLQMVTRKYFIFVLFSIGFYRKSNPDPKQTAQSEEGTAPRLPLSDFVTTRHVTRTLSVVLLQQSQEVLHFLGDRRFSQGL